MKRFFAFFLAAVFAAGLFAFDVRAEEAQYYDPDDGVLTHLELLEQLCSGFPGAGYEEYPEPPQYFQEDYPDVPYGGYGDTLKTHGCGITVLAMMATYYTERPHLPKEMAEKYRRYGSEQGTDFMLFVTGPAEMGFPLEKITSRWKDACEALAEGKLVVNLQLAGNFTTTGHFILLTGLTEDGKVLVRDPSYRNHTVRFAGTDFFETGFEPEFVAACSKRYWIFGKKPVGVNGCGNCADPESGTEFTLTENYFCNGCAGRKEKHRCYQDLMTGSRHGVTTEESSGV